MSPRGTPSREGRLGDGRPGGGVPGGYTVSGEGWGESMTHRELEAELAALSKAEKAEVVERLAQEISDAWPGIEKTPGVCGAAPVSCAPASPCGFSRTTDGLVGPRRRSSRTTRPSGAADLVHAWACVDARREEIDEAIRQNEAW